MCSQWEDDVVDDGGMARLDQVRAEVCKRELVNLGGFCAHKELKEQISQFMITNLHREGSDSYVLLL